MRLKDPLKSWDISNAPWSFGLKSWLKTLQLIGLQPPLSLLVWHSYRQSQLQQWIGNARFWYDHLDCFIESWIIFSKMAVNLNFFWPAVPSMRLHEDIATTCRRKQVPIIWFLSIDQCQNGTKNLHKWAPGTTHETTFCSFSCPFSGASSLSCEFPTATLNANWLTRVSCLNTSTAGAFIVCLYIVMSSLVSEEWRYLDGATW